MNFHFLFVIDILEVYLNLPITTPVIYEISFPSFPLTLINGQFSIHTFCLSVKPSYCVEDVGLPFFPLVRISNKNFNSL